MQNPTAQTQLQTLCNMGIKTTLTNYNPFVIWNQITHNIRKIKSERTKQYFYTKTEYKRIKNNVEDLTLV